MSGAPANIAARLPEMAAQQPHRPAIFFPEGRNAAGRRLYSHYTYAQLDAASDRIAAGLVELGIGRGVRTVLMVKPSLELFALTFGLFKAGAVPVMVDPGIGRRNIKLCLAEAEPEAFIGLPVAHAARLLFGWGRATIRTCVTVGRRWFWGGETLRGVHARGAAVRTFAIAATKAEETAAILFTSGSTGVPKGVVYEHRHFLAQVESIGRHYRIAPGEIDLPTFPLFALFDPALGMTTIIPDMDATRPADADPRLLIEAIEDFGVTNLFGSPALLRRLGSFAAAQGVTLPTVKRIISSGAPVTAGVLHPFVGVLGPGAAIHPSYGATEAMPMASITHHEVLAETQALTARGAGICLGRPLAGLDVRIIGIDEQPIPVWSEALALPPEQIGEIVVRGPVVTRAYFRRDKSTTLAKIVDGNTFFHRMGDLGYLDGSGRLWFCGRKAHRVITPTAELYTVPCEGVFDAHPAVKRSALVGVQVAGRTEPLVCVELESGGRVQDQARLFDELRELGRAVERTRAIERFLVHPGFPVDIRHNAKIDRPALSRWAQGRW